ncbi:unnamed protein product [Mytilus coruscus]|uniref:IPO4 n=1 Tax=Mytilus coruscus TaxID=42192 RepID=A0A6J8B0Q1_MYTCO|nr:IPO4 [Mytilus coruscus]CAC5376958.1 unnamed protein product [Mytilus coruscus]
MSQELEDTLAKLLVPDNNTIQQATQQLKELFKDPDIIPGLFKVLGLSQVPQVRQYAAVLIRRKIQKSRHWHAQSVVIQQNIRENILQILLQESEKNVRNAIAQVVATVAKHDLPKNQWPQLFQFLTAYTKSQNPVEREEVSGASGPVHVKTQRGILTPNTINMAAMMYMFASFIQSVTQIVVGMQQMVTHFAA